MGALLFSSNESPLQGNFIDNLPRELIKKILFYIDGRSIYRYFRTRKFFPFVLIDLLREKWFLISRFDANNYSLKQVVHCLDIPNQRYLFHGDFSDLFWIRIGDKFSR